MEFFTLDESSWNKFHVGLESAELLEEENKIMNLENEKWKILQDALSSINPINDNPRALIVFEFVYHIVHFCSQSKFSYTQMSAVLTIFGKVFEACIIDGKLREGAVKMFTSQMSNYTTLLDIESIRRVTVLFSDTIVKHFDAYKFVLRELPDERVEYLKVIVQTPISILPALSEGETLDSNVNDTDEVLDEE